MMSRRIPTAIAAAGLALSAAALHAQDNRDADSLLRRGDFARAESQYYAAVRARPREPHARLALGQYLIARGAMRTGVVLIDEAVQFGLDRRTAAGTLAPAYMALGEYQALEK